MSRRRRVVATMLALRGALAFCATCDLAQAEPGPPSDAAAAPVYTLEVDSDAPDVVSFEALAARIGTDLGAAVVRPRAQAPSRVAITIRYRGRELVVRAVHAGGRVLERTVDAQGDDAAVQREAVLLAGNLARDEAREILDELATRPPPAVAVPAPPPEPRSAEPTVDEGEQPVSFSFLFPLATNFARPDVATNMNVSLLYGRVGKVDGLQFGSGIAFASRHLNGAQIVAFGGVTQGPARGLQMSGFGNVATESVRGVQLGGFGNVAGTTRGPIEGLQLAGGGNVAWAGFTGAQIAGGANIARGPASGLAFAGGANIVTDEMEGAQIGGVNVAGHLDGLQLGVINVGRRVRGLQLGVINVAEEVDGASIGVISVTKDGIHPIAWTSNLAYLNAGLKFSTRYIYTLAAAHTGTIEGDFGNVGITAAFGVHIPLPARFDVETQLAISHLVPRPSQSSKNGNVWMSEEILAGYSLASHFRVFAGGGLRHRLSVDLGRDIVRPEVLAGVQF